MRLHLLGIGNHVMSLYWIVRDFDTTYQPVMLAI